jgi:ABC-type transport system substrate-binding protein
MDWARYTLDVRKLRWVYGEATRLVHEDKPWLELFQEVVIYGVSMRVSLEPRADDRLLASELALAR